MEMSRNNTAAFIERLAYIPYNYNILTALNCEIKESDLYNIK